MPGAKARRCFQAAAPLILWNTTAKPSAPDKPITPIYFRVALGAIGCEAHRVTEEMFLAAAKTLAGMVTEDNLKTGTLYPPLKDIRAVSATIAKAVMAVAVQRRGLAGITYRLRGLKMYDPLTCSLNTSLLQS